jgi:hypothetical protein
MTGIWSNSICLTDRAEPPGASCAPVGLIRTFAPNSLSPDIAALTEPMAVALHAVRRSEIGRRDVAIVVGCGPVGLAVICHLKALGVRTIVASDFSAGRRALAGRCGADVVVDPAVDSPYAAASTKGVVHDAPVLYELAMSSMEKLRRIPGWSHLYRAADALGGAGPKRPIVCRRSRRHRRSSPRRR